MTFEAFCALILFDVIAGVVLYVLAKHERKKRRTIVGSNVAE